ncbi:hypothetical protein FB45DRAFT_26580 [Roridomyces roridus]|uniref:DUF6534 domain-containing protein n=1 Tax=Roridomyces roridus TaxID=1738132 RepID=A0AAD7CK02_9AGAR|nr:hypothetical protein FB45DRAFT_26580 [Roridomyces roridus]
MADSPPVPDPHIVLVYNTCVVRFSPPWSALTLCRYVLVSPWINSMLYMLEIVLVVQYLQQSRTRHLFIRAGIVAMLLFDTVCTVVVCAESYYSLVQVRFDKIFTYTAVQLFSTYGTASIEQLFLCRIYYILTNNWFITLLLIALVALHLVASYVSGILLLTTGSPFGAAFLTTKIGAISCASTDVLIASVLMFTFVRMEISSAVRPSTHRLLHRLIIITFTSGVLVASCTLLVMVFLLKGNPAYLLFFNCQGRIYALTILTNFLVGPAAQASVADTQMTLPMPSVVFRNHSQSNGLRSAFNNDNPDPEEIVMISLQSLEDTPVGTPTKSRITPDP